MLGVSKIFFRMLKQEGLADLLLDMGQMRIKPLRTIRMRRKLGRVRPWGDNMTAWRKKQIQNIKLLSMPIIVNISLNLRMFCWIFYQSLICVSC